MAGRAGSDVGWFNDRRILGLILYLVVLISAIRAGRALVVYSPFATQRLEPIGSNSSDDSLISAGDITT